MHIDLEPIKMPVRDALKLFALSTTLTFYKNKGEFEAQEMIKLTPEEYRRQKKEAQSALDAAWSDAKFAPYFDTRREPILEALQKRGDYVFGKAKSGALNVEVYFIPIT